MMSLITSVHPCDRKDEKACDQICNKLSDKHECACNKDFKLGDDKKTCEERKLLFFTALKTKLSLRIELESLWKYIFTILNENID